MYGLEKMLSSMIGLTPEQMQDLAKNAIELLEQLNKRLQEIEATVKHNQAYIGVIVDDITRINEYFGDIDPIDGR
jgi:hypothetical protein